MIRHREPTFGFLTITPEMAAEMLAKSKRRNRKVSSFKATQYAAVMKAGRWNPHNSQAVSRDRNGDIVNGHTRLTACADAGVPFTTAFMDGVEPDAFADEDTGKTRNNGEAFFIRGLAEERLAGLTAAACRAVEFFDRGMWRHAGAPRAANRLVAAVVTNDQLFEAYRRRPLIRKAVAYVHAKRHLLRGYPTGAMAALWVLTHGNPAHEAFWGELADGLNMTADSPVRLLKERMAKQENSGSMPKGGNLMALVTKLWNAYQAGGRVAQLSWKPGLGEKFPDPVTRLKPAFPDFGRDEDGDLEQLKKSA